MGGNTAVTHEAPCGFPQGEQDYEEADTTKYAEEPEYPVPTQTCRECTAENRTEWGSNVWTVDVSLKQ